MFNYENGKKIVFIGFAISLLVSILNFIFSFFIGFVMNAGSNFVWGIVDLLGFLGTISSLVVIGGFGIMWLANRQMLDLITAAVLFVSLVIDFIISTTGGSTVSLSLLSAIIAAAFYILIGLRFKDKNRMLFLLLCGAGVFKFLIPVIILFSLGLGLRSGLFGLSYVFSSFIFNIVPIACTGLCVIAAKQEI